jgi:membrane associated rhomboid family serine protease
VVANLVTWLILGTLVTDPAVSQALRFDPAVPIETAWALLTYPWIHEGLFHLTLTSLLLLLAGTRVERELGPRSLVALYCCGTIAAALSGVVVSLLVPTPPMAGALGPALALLFARGWYAETEEVSLAPLPFAVTGRVAVAAVGLGLVVAGVLAHDPGLSIAHAGGLLGGWTYFRWRTLASPPAPPAAVPLKRTSMTPIRLRAEGAAAAGASGGPAPSSSYRPAAATTLDDVNRVLDKINAVGIQNLTEEERQLLRRYAEQQRDRT